MKNEILYSLDQLQLVAQDLIKLINLFPITQGDGYKSNLKHAAIITLSGDLGVGKTTLVKQLLRAWGVQTEVLSPTFNYVNCYKNDQGQTIYHFDLYRISNLDQFSELGFDEYLHESSNICLIEWPEVINPFLENMLVYELEIEHISKSKRKLTIK